MKVLNKTHYYNLYSKQYNFVDDPNSFRYQSSKRTGYFQRLYWEYEETKKLNGQTFYLTFTYNDLHIPKFTIKVDDEYKSYPVFNYDHIRLISHGALSKHLERHYGSSLSYFCACESGEGGNEQHHKRGAGNNPHYHFIFFVKPYSLDYKPILPKEFKALCQELWVGKRGYFNWKFARFGSVKEGKFGIVVKDSRAFKYVSKYCLKDNEELAVEKDLVVQFRYQAYTLVNSFYAFKRYYWYLKSREIQLDKRTFCSRFGFLDYNHYRHSYLGIKSVKPIVQLELFSDFHNYEVHSAVIDSSLWSYKDWFKNNCFKSIDYWYTKYRYWFDFYFVPSYVEFKLSMFRKQYSGKVRCSHSLGFYGLSQIQNIETKPFFTIIEKKEPKNYRPCLYYIRKLYYEVITCPVTGNPLYRLTPLGKKCKLSQLEHTIGSFYHKTLDNINLQLHNKLSFDYKGEFYNTYLSLQSLKLSQDYFKTIYKYSVFHCVYQFRAFNASSPIRLSDAFNIDHIKEDYSMFLDFDRSVIDYKEGTIMNVYSVGSGNMPFDFLQPFKAYFKLFDFLDAVNDFSDKTLSDIRKEEFKTNSESLKRLNAYENNIS